LSQNAASFGRHGAQALHPARDGGLSPELSVHAVVAELEVGRRGDHAVDAAGLQSGEGLGGVPDEDGVAGRHTWAPRAMRAVASAKVVTTNRGQASVG
jgi:hypothetical protein